MSEPTTTVTDALLAVLALLLARLLWPMARDDGSLVAWLWVAGFLSTALAAGLGSASHGIGPRLGSLRRQRLWMATLGTALVANAAFLAAVTCLALDGSLLAATLIAIVAVLAYWLHAILVDPRYRQVIAAGAVTIVVAASLTAWSWWHAHATWAPWVAAGLACAAVGAGVQGRGVGRIGRLNHNDVYHVLQGIALWLWYRAALMGGP